VKALLIFFVCLSVLCWIAVVLSLFQYLELRRQGFPDFLININDKPLLLGVISTLAALSIYFGAMV